MLCFGLLLGEIIFGLGGCSCPDEEFRNYTAHVYLANNSSNSASLNIRVEYSTKSYTDYRYLNITVPPEEQVVAEIKTGAYTYWKQGHSDCGGSDKIGNTTYEHDAEFSVDTISSFTICRETQTFGTYFIYENGTNCPIGTYRVEQGWN